MANEHQRDWNHLLVNTVLSAAVGAAVSHFLREHMGGRARAEREELQERQSAIVQQQQAQLERLLGASRMRPPFAPPPPAHMHGLPYGPPGYAHAQPQAYAHTQAYPQQVYARPVYPAHLAALPSGGHFGEES